jgi:hypothetical protein
MVLKRVCESCFYTGDDYEYLQAGDFCTECMSVHSMCPRCNAAYHSALITDDTFIFERYMK